MSDKYLWKFGFNCGRQGELEGLFVATEQEVQEVIGKEAYFGEVLGKHSDIYGTIEEREIVKLDLDTDTVEKVSMLLGDNWSGFNPLEYVSYDCSKCGESCRSEEICDVDGEKVCYDCQEKEE